MSFKRIDSTANRLREALSAANKKPIELADETGINKGTLSHYLKGDYEPKQNTINVLSKALNVSEMWLWGYDCPMGRNNISSEEQLLNKDYIENLAKTFNIPVSEVANIEIPKNINEEKLDKELIERLSKLSNEDIQRVNDFVAGIISTRDKKGH